MYTIAPTQDVKRFESQQLTAPLSSLNTLIILAFSLPWTRGCPTAGFFWGGGWCVCMAANRVAEALAVNAGNPDPSRDLQTP